jgi:hypothetical protein
MVFTRKNPAKSPVMTGDALLDAAARGLLSPADEDAILLEAARRTNVRTFFPSLEELVSSEQGFGVKTISPLQQAICRLIQGAPLGELAKHPHVAEGLGLTTREVEAYESTRAAKGFPIATEFFVIAAIRSGKSLLMAASAIWASQNINVDRCGPGEIPRYSIISISLDNAKATLMHLLGALKRPRLSRLRIDDKELGKWSDWREIVKESSADLVGSVFLWHPTGRPIEIRVVAGKRAGGSTVSRWSAGCGLDEAPRMVGASEGVFNYDDIRRSVLGRLLPGAQLFSMGSPWASLGPVFDTVQEWWGQPQQERLIVKAPGYLMNPVTWTPEACEKLKALDPVAYQTDVLAEFADAGEALIPQALIARCSREDSAAHKYIPGRDYAAAMDPATRGNSWTLVIVDRAQFVDDHGMAKHKTRVVLNTQWTGNQLTPIRPRQVLGEIAEILKEYRLDWVYTDQWSADAIKDIGLEVGLAILPEQWKQQEEVTKYLGLRALMTEGLIEIPNDPILQKDLRLVHRVVNQRGLAIHLAETADGRHCDFTPALMRAVSRWLKDEEQARPAPGTPEAMQAQLDEWREKAYQKATVGSTNWWQLDPQQNPDAVLSVTPRRFS